MKTEILDILTEVAKRKGKFTTTILAKKVGCSQQTVSRKIRYLETKGMIGRVPHHQGQIITLTERGRRFLRKKFLELKDAVEYAGESPLSFGGNLISGSGEGKYYVSQDEYFLQFQEKIGFRPFLGTLNLRLKSVNDASAKNRMENTNPVIVEGFEKDNRTFGNIHCYPCVVDRKVRGAVIIPERSHHPHDIVEVIAPVYLRKGLSLRDGDYVHLEVRA